MKLLTDRRFWLRIGLSGGLVALLAWRLDIGEALRTFTEVNFLFVLPALAIFALSKLVDAYRWRLMLSRLGSVPLSDLFGIYLVHNLANNLLPMRAGDILRVQVPAQRYGLPRAGLAATVFVTETLADGVAFVILGLLGLALLDVPDPIRNSMWSLLAVVSVGLLLTLWLARIRLSPGWHESRWLRWLPQRASKALSEALPPFLEGLATLRDPALGSRVLALSLVAWLLEAVMFWLFGLALGLDLPFATYLIIMVAANLIIAVPIAPSNIGPYEVALTEVVALLGVERVLAGGYAIGTHLLNILWVGVLGLISMWMLGLGLKDIFYLRRQANDVRAPLPQPEAGSDPPG